VRDRLPTSQQATTLILSSSQLALEFVKIWGFCGVWFGFSFSFFGFFGGVGE
jgi:hypothetical protein